MAPGIINSSIRHIVSSIMPNKPDGADIEVTMTISLKGFANPVSVSQRLSANDLKEGLSMTPPPLRSMLNALLPPLQDRASIVSPVITITPLAEAKTGCIKEAAFTRRTAKPGETVNLRVRLVGPFAEVKDITLPVTVPAGYSRPEFTVSVHAGKSVRPNENTPGTPEEIALWLSGIARSDDLVLLSPCAVNASAYPVARLNRSVARTAWNVEGSAEASLSVTGSE